MINELECQEQKAANSGGFLDSFKQSRDKENYGKLWNIWNNSAPVMPFELI